MSPRHIRLSLAVDEPPVHAADVLLCRHRQAGFDQRVMPPVVASALVTAVAQLRARAILGRGPT